MAISPLANVLPMREDDEDLMPPPMAIDLDQETGPQSRFDGNTKITELGDGSALFDFNPQAEAKTKTDKFDANLANEIDDGELGKIANDLLTGIQADDSSRQEWLQTHAEGIKLLGLVIDDVNSAISTSAAPSDGVLCTARHPLLLEAVLAGQATARGELLPASGPVKVRDDRPVKPAPVMPPMAAPMMGHNGGPPLGQAGAVPPNNVPPMAGNAPGGVPPVPLAQAGQVTPIPGNASPPGSLAGPLPPPMMAPPGTQDRDALADALEKDFNHYLTVTAQEYYPDTDRMLFSVFFGGQGVKKVYNCPLRRRPVSESIAMEDFIVSNALTDLSNASRITHRIKMRPSVLKRMQLLNVYCDINVGTPTQSSGVDAVTQAKAEVAGVQPQAQDPKDADHELYECYCELNLTGDELAPKQFREKGLALPYRVTIDKDSQKILEIRRNWRKDDQECKAREFFVEFSYDKAFGFYGIGLLHILGNTTKTLTAAWREFIDAGMFANFPGFIFAKGAGRQITNQFRVAPGQGVGLDVGLTKLGDAVQPLPYRDLGPAFVAFIQHVEELGQRLGGTANMSVGEGKQDAPVGTTLALIEQATKTIGAVLKRLHSAQSKELQLIADRFRDDPESFWKFNRRPMVQWQKEQFLTALSDFDLVPVSDPNNPTRMHRAAKSQALIQMATAAPGLLDPRKVFKRAAQNLEIDDPDDLLAAPMPAQEAQPTPADQAKMAAAQAKMQGDQIRAQADIQQTQIQQQGDLAELQQRERIALIQQETERIKLGANLALHSQNAESKERIELLKLAQQRESKLMDHIHDHRKAELERGHQLQMNQRKQEPQS